MLHATKDKNNYNCNHEAQVKLFFFAKIFKLEIGKLMHKLYNNQPPEFFKQYFTEIKQIVSYATRLSCHKNYFLSQYRLKQNQSQVTYLSQKIWAKISDQIKNYLITLSLRNFQFIFKIAKTTDVQFVLQWVSI